MATDPPGTGGSARVTLPLHEEQLRIRTRTVETGGGVRVHKTVVEHPNTIEQTLLHDEVEVKHVPVDRIVALDQAPEPRYEGETLVVPVLEEVLVVERKLRIKEEIRITRTGRAQHYSETVVLKSEQVSIERFDGADKQAK
jgi:uncharacterized protein (TIGR02271 family)